MKTLSIIEIEGNYYNQAGEELTYVPKTQLSAHLKDADGQVVAKCCTTCSEMKIATREFFQADVRRFAGLQAKCKSCVSKRDAYFRTSDWVRKPQKPTAQRFYNEAGECTAKVCPGCSQRKERNEYGTHLPNHDGMTPYCLDCLSVYRHNKRAMDAGLPATLTAYEWAETRRAFGGKCALSGEDIDVTFEHSVPMSKKGGTTAYNCYPVSAKLNRAKYTKHLYEWAEEDGVDKVRFARLIKHLADRCGLSPEDYRKYYDWAYVTNGDTSISAYNRILA